MNRTVIDLLDANTRAQFKGLVDEVMTLVDRGMIDQAITKIRSGARIVKSMPLTKSFFEALPAASNQTLASFFSHGSVTSALGSPVLAYSGHHGMYCRCVICSFSEMIAKIAPLLAKAVVIGGIAAILFLFEVTAVAIAVICFMILVLWIAYEGQQPPRVAQNSHPAFMARLQQEMASIDRQVRSCGVLS